MTQNQVKISYAQVTDWQTWSDLQHDAFTEVSYAEFDEAKLSINGAQRLVAGSTDWLRHTYGTHVVAAGMPLDVLQQNMGHASLATTTGYTGSEERRRMKASQAAWRKTEKGRIPEI